MALLKEDEFLHPYHIPTLQNGESSPISPSVNTAIYLTDSADETIYYQRHNKDWYNFPIMSSKDHLHIHLEKGTERRVIALSLFIGAQEISLPLPAAWPEQADQTDLQLSLPPLPYGAKALLCICVKDLQRPVCEDSSALPQDLG